MIALSEELGACGLRNAMRSSEDRASDDLYAGIRPVDSADFRAVEVMAFEVILTRVDMFFAADY